MKIATLLAVLTTTALIDPQAIAQQAAPAATPADAGPADIIVTAQKRSENVQKVPIPVTVISADQLVRRGVQGIQDLSQASASL